MNYDIPNPDDRVLGRVLERHAERFGDRDFLLHGDHRFSYAQTDEMVNRYAAGLSRLGLGQGDALCIVMRNSPELLFLALAATRLGAIFITTNTDYKGEWLAHALEDSRARILAVDGDLLPRIAAVQEAAASFQHVLVHGEPAAALPVHTVPVQELAAEQPRRPDVAISPRDVAQVWWTSGTTGRSKGVMNSHASLIHAVKAAADLRGIEEGDVFYACTPMYLGGAWTGGVWIALLTGLTVGLDETFSVSRFWSRVRHYNATQLFTLGAMHMFLWQAPRRDDDADNPARVGLLVPMPYDIVPQFKERFGLQRLVQAYGQSETPSGVFHAADDGHQWKKASMGVRVPWLEVKLFDENDVEVPVGETGEICVRPRHPDLLFSGYYGAPQVTLDTWRNLWHHSGDMAREDEDGEFFFMDRKKDYIRYKGRNISSVEVETAASRHPAVADVAAHAVQSEELASESELKLCVVVREGETLTAEELARHINDIAPYFFVPRYIEFVDELPRTPHGRVEKYKLRERGVTAGTWDRDAAGFQLAR